MGGKKENTDGEMRVGFLGMVAGCRETNRILIWRRDNDNLLLKLLPF